VSTNDARGPLTTAARLKEGSR